MEAGLFYTAIGPGLLALVSLLFVFVTFRRPLWGAVGFLAFVLAAPYVAWRVEVQALLIGAAEIVLVVAALVRRPAVHRWAAGPVDRTAITYAACLLLASLLGLVAGNSRAYWAGDVYHFVLGGPLLYLALRALLHPEDVARVVSAYIGLAATSAAIAIVILAAGGENGNLVWLVGAPLDEGGVRLEHDFGFPLVPLLLVAARLSRRVTVPTVIAGVILAAALVLTYKRTLWGATLVGLAVILLAGWWAARPPVATLARRFAVLGLVLGGGVLAAVGLGLNTGSAARRSADLTRPEQVGTVHSRLEETRSVVRYVGDRPWGHGLGAAVRLPYGRTDGALTHHVHNSYLQLGLQAGLQTTVTVIVLLVTFWFATLRAARDPDVLGASAGVTAIAVAGVAVLSFHTPIAAVALALGVTRATQPEPGDGQRVGVR